MRERQEAFRDARLIVIASEGKDTERIYFKALAKEYTNPRVHVHILERSEDEQNIQMNSIIHILPALHGDAFILDLWNGDNHGIVVVDSGPSFAGRRILKNFYDYDKIDLMIISHFDDDHIAGIKKYAQEVCIGNKDWNVHQMWVNNSKDFPVEIDPAQSLPQATTLADALEKINERYPDFIWKPYISEGFTLDLGFTNIEVVSPPMEYEKCMIRKLKEQENLSEGENKNQVDPLTISLEELAKMPDHEPELDIYDELANATSIAFILKSEDLSVLMLGDSYPQNIETYLRKKYSEQDKLKIDFVKVSHHGSLVNSSTTLYDIIECNNFIISTNGKKYGHPDREAIAKIVCHPHRSNEKIHIYLNYPKENYAPFLNDDEEDRYNFKVHYDINKLPNYEQNNG